MLSINETLTQQAVGTVPQEPKPHAHLALNQFQSTAIVGNDLLSSCLYIVPAICWSPRAYRTCVGQHFFRFIYSEVVTALPINGGTYNALLNTTSKSIASIAACLSLLSYIATAVVSAYSAVQYIQPIWLALQDGGAATGATILILATFAGLTLFGIGESSIIAILMFTLHYAMMTALIIMSFVFAFRDGWHIFQENVYSGFPTLAPNDSGQPGYALFLGFAAALLGISGFETAANYGMVSKTKQIQ